MSETSITRVNIYFFGCKDTFFGKFASHSVKKIYKYFGFIQKKSRFAIESALINLKTNNLHQECRTHRFIFKDLLD